MGLGMKVEACVLPLLYPGIACMSQLWFQWDLRTKSAVVLKKCAGSVLMSPVVWFHVHGASIRGGSSCHGWGSRQVGSEEELFMFTEWTWSLWRAGQIFLYIAHSLQASQQVHLSDSQPSKGGSQALWPPAASKQIGLVKICVCVLTEPEKITPPLWQKNLFVPLQ
jgi:hypothetical protein